MLRLFFIVALFGDVLAAFVAIASTHNGSTSDSPTPPSQQRYPEYSRISRIFAETFLRDGSYSSFLRPRWNQHEPVRITVDFFLENIEFVKEKEQYIVVMGWFALEWVDEVIREFFDRIRNESMEPAVLVVPSDRIWTPDIEVLSNDGFPIDLSAFPARVDPDGNVVIFAGGTMKLACPMDLTHFPFDEIECMMSISTWASGVDEVQLIGATIDTNSTRFGEWDLVKMTNFNNTYDYDGVNLTMVGYYITLRRRPLYLVMTVLLPTVMQAALIVVVFLIPPDTGERASFSITVLLAFSVWSLSINEDMPRNSDTIPLIGVFVCVLQAMGALAVVQSIVIVHIHSSHNAHIPSWAISIHQLARRRSPVIAPIDEESISKQTHPSFERLPWQRLILTLDRAFFWIFFLIMLAILAVFLSRYWHHMLTA